MSSGRLGRPGDREPHRRDDVGIAGLGEGRHVRIIRQPRRGAERERARLAGLDLARGGRERGRHGLDLPAHQVGHRGRRALVRNVLQVDAGLLLEELGDELALRAVARRAVGHAGFCFASATNSLSVFAGSFGFTASTAGGPPKSATWVKSFIGSYGVPLRQLRRDHVRGDARHDKRVAIGRALRRRAPSRARRPRRAGSRRRSSPSAARRASSRRCGRACRRCRPARRAR